jgi:hypothetical protein
MRCSLLALGFANVREQDGRWHANCSGGAGCLLARWHSRKEGKADGWTVISYIQFSRRALGVFRLRGRGTPSGAVWLR